ncbi:sensor histidine kinase [Chitinophaga vietnamensis]|uniref:sensor histidine kinase n=1 Tax=Chitinophaga vietnamensis TaxID=2593957 RepID=UPI001177CF25|nr:ATP-binding protein [Chitinophaga vietnamensis]
MRIRFTTKLTLGLACLSGIVLAFGITGIIYIYQQHNNAQLILRNNHRSLIYANNMDDALLQMASSGHYSGKAAQQFRNNLQLQLHNITEPGEAVSSYYLLQAFNALMRHPGDAATINSLRAHILEVEKINQQAILAKSQAGHLSVQKAITVLVIIAVLLTLFSIIFINRLYAYDNIRLAQLKSEKARIEAIIRQMRDGIIGFDDNRQVLFINQAAARLFQLNEKQVIGMNADHLSQKNDLIKIALDKQDLTPVRMMQEDKPVYYQKEVIGRDADIPGEVLIFRDITPFQELAEAKTHFIATVSHELKTPISAVKMCLSLLKDQRVSHLDCSQRELLDSIEDDIARLLAITSELLDLAQVEAGNITLRQQDITANDIVQRATDAVRVQAKQKQVRIRIHLPETLPLIYADPEKTAWVLVNFLTNAIRYSPEQAMVQVRAERCGTQVVFTVQDEGPGIADVYLPRVFDRYFKVPGSGSQQGTGLGLAISREFIEAQHGSIHASSEYGRGATFSFSLPIK